MKERIAYATLVGLVAYAAVATDLYLPALPAIVDEFNVSEAQGQLTLSLFMLGMAVGQLFFGPLSDFYGRLPVVTVGTIFFHCHLCGLCGSALHGVHVGDEVYSRIGRQFRACHCPSHRQ